ncbi:DUF1015 domain-containing protein [Chloroflexota bacterium]
MADIRPFRGVHYNGSVIKDWSAVICPPYDIITPQQQQDYYLKSEHNFIRLEYGRELPQDTATDNKYTRSAATLEQWLREGVLEVDEVPTIYLHDHRFTYQGKQYQRRSMVTRVRVEEWDRMVVRPHEGTLTEARGDRLSLLWAIQSNTSPILTLYEDREQQIAPLLTSQERSRPLISISDINGEGHTVWALTDAEVLKRISSVMDKQPLYIADGHHRYESALAYRNERLIYPQSTSGDEAFNFVMMSLVDFSDPGLIILAPHRLVRGIPRPTLEGLMDKLKVFFEIEELPLSRPDIWRQVNGLLSETGRVTVALFGPAADRLYILKLSDPAAVSQMIPYFHSELYKKLDVSIVDHIILENLLALSSEQEKTSLAYSYDMPDAVNRVLNQEYQLALLLCPIKPEVIKTISDAGDKMPRKSTYFYPKPPSGLVFNQLV